MRSYPHPGEAARLLDKSITEIQDNRIKATLQISKKYNAYCLLKGVGSVFGDKKGNWLINNSGNPGMATAGMGDVLSGFIGALASQDVNLSSATIAAVRIHGLAADSLVNKNIGPIGLTASETINEARRLINRMDS